MIETKKIIFSGRVQGVFFRATAKQYAEELGVRGSVRNLPNGDVELIAHGSSECTEKLIHKLLHQFLCQIIKKETLSYVSFSGFTILRN